MVVYAIKVISKGTEQPASQRPRESRFPWARFPLPETCPAILFVRTAMATRVALTLPLKLLCLAGVSTDLMTLGAFTCDGKVFADSVAATFFLRATSLDLAFFVAAFLVAGFFLVVFFTEAVLVDGAESLDTTGLLTEGLAAEATGAIAGEVALRAAALACRLRDCFV